MDDFDGLLDGGLQQFDYVNNYSQIELEKVELTLQQKCRLFINAMSDLYLKIELDDNDIIVSKGKQIAEQMVSMEIVPLSTYLYQVKIGKHVLNTLAIQLNSGGYADAELFKRIHEAQECLRTTMTAFVKYIRTLPHVFAEIRAEMELLDKSLTGDDISFEDVPNKGLESPVRGQAALLDALMESRDALLADINDAKSIDVSREGNVGNNPLRDSDGKFINDENDLL